MDSVLYSIQSLPLIDEHFKIHSFKHTFKMINISFKSHENKTAHKRSSLNTYFFIVKYCIQMSLFPVEMQCISYITDAMKSTGQEKCLYMNEAFWRWYTLITEIIRNKIGHDRDNQCWESKDVIIYLVHGNSTIERKVGKCWVIYNA